jgi:hypothetical protein
MRYGAHVKVECLLDPDPGVVYPRLIEATGRCRKTLAAPGLRRLLDAIRDPKHERHIELKEWISYDFDPSIPRGSPQKSPRWRKAGLEALLRGALDARKPRCSSDGCRTPCAARDHRWRKRRDHRGHRGRRDRGIRFPMAPYGPYAV